MFLIPLTSTRLSVIRIENTPIIVSRTHLTGVCQGPDFWAQALTVLLNVFRSNQTSVTQILKKKAGVELTLNRASENISVASLNPGSELTAGRGALETQGKRRATTRPWPQKHVI